MTPNPIDEIKKIRHQLGAEVGFDIHRVFADLRAAQAASDRTYVQQSPQRAAGANGAHGTHDANNSWPGNDSA